MKRGAWATKKERERKESALMKRGQNVSRERGRKQWIL